MLKEHKAAILGVKKWKAHHPVWLYHCNRQNPEGFLTFLEEAIAVTVQASKDADRHRP